MNENRSWHGEFPVTRDWVYLDLANKAPLPRRVKTAWEGFLNEMHETPGPKEAWKNRLEVLRHKIATLIGARSGEIAFTKNTSEALNIIAQCIPMAPGDNLVVHAREHPNNLHTWLHLRSKGVDVRVVESPGDDVRLEDISSAIDLSTRLVAVSAVSYCTGRKLDLKTLAGLCHAQNALLIVDGVQAVGTVRLNVADLGIDAMACGSQKGLLCTHGIGFLYCREDLARDLTPVYAARSSLASHDFATTHLDFLPDARRFEHGNLNYGGAYALDAAIDLIADVGLSAIETRVKELTDHLIGLLEARGLPVITPRTWEDRAGIVVFGVDHPLRVHADLTAKKFVLSAVEGGIRAVPHFYNNESELEALAAAL